MAARVGLGDYNFYLPYIREHLDRLSPWELNQLRKNQLAALRRWLEHTLHEPDHPEMLGQVTSLMETIGTILASKHHETVR